MSAHARGCVKTPKSQQGGYLDAMMVSRAQRLASVTASILRVLWYIVFVGAFLMIEFLWMLHMELVPQIILGGITAFSWGS
jgi:hypothetical protein